MTFIIEMTDPFSWPTDGGQTGALMRDHDWSTSPLGSPREWPQSLRSVVELLLGSKFPMFVAWGDGLGFLYNDAYAEILGAKHPAAMGARFFDIWSEIWSDISPLIEAALAGQATFREDLPLVMNRRGFDEQTWFTFSYSPVRDDAGRIRGMFCACTETTQRVLMERRQAFLVRLSDVLRSNDDPIALTLHAASLLGQHLGAGRAGYGQIDRTGEVVSVQRDWAGGTMGSLAGEARVLDAFGPEVIAELRAGRTLVVEDCRTDPRTARAEYLPTWESIGTRALIVAPLVREGRLGAILYVHVAEPRRWTPLETELVEEVATRTWDAVQRAQAEAGRRETEGRFRNMADHSPVMMWVTEPSGYCTYLNRRWYEFTGQSESAGEGYGWLDAVHPHDRPAAEQAFVSATAERREYRIDFRLRRSDGTYRWALDTAAPRFSHEGDFLGFVGSVIDIDEIREAEEHQRLLINELNHRVKNTLATVQSIASQTLRNTETAEEARGALESRLLALSRAHDVLTRENWDGADLREIVAEAVAPYSNPGEDRLHLSGETIRLPPRMALALAMALQELATNAVKYGALSNNTGEVRIQWRDGDDRLHLTWSESGGPPVKTPSRRGFGTRLIERSLASDLDGEVSIAFEPTGLICTVDAPLTRPEAPQPA